MTIQAIQRAIKKQWYYFGMYLSFLISGVMAGIFPSQAILSIGERASAYAWAVFLIVGSASSLYGIVSDKWTGEAFGVPAVWAASTIFGVALIWAGQSMASVSIGWVFIGLSFGLIGRWRNAMRTGKISRESA